jgi:serine/threonine-protein kinase
VTPEQWARAKAVFTAALERSPNERALFVAQACGTDSELRTEVESLLATSETADGFLSGVATGLDLAARLNAALSGRYVVERELGRGGMATVYLARDLRHKRRVALKVLAPELSSALGATRFVREVEVAAGLAHPHLVPLFDSGEADGLLFYTMPFIDGETLRERLRREGALPVAEAVRVLREVADALAYAHDRGVVHRDLKPENVLLSRTHALVADFGVAKAIAAATQAGDEVTSAGLALGTPGYMAPEQALGDPSTDHRADLYALGVIAYELLAGAHPFGARTPQALLAAHASEPPQHLSGRRVGVARPLAALVMRLLEKLPGNRPESADQVIRELDALSTSPAAMTPPAPEAAPQPNAPARASWRQPPQRVAAAASAILLLVAIGYGVASLSDATTSGVTGREISRLREPNGGTLNSIAVLPFVNMSADPDNEYFSDGITEELINALANVDGIRVAARTSCFAFKGKNTDVAKIAAKLHVATLVEGSVRRAGDRLRVTAQLIDARDGYHLWSDTYDRRLADVLDVQTEITRAIVASLKNRVYSGAGRLAVSSSSARDSALASPNSGRRDSIAPASNPRDTSVGIVGRSHTPDFRAYDLYLKGRYAWNHRTAAALAEAAQYFEQAAARDPRFAQAYVGIADAYVLLPQYGGKVTPAQAWERAKTAARRALALDSTLAAAHASLAFGKTIYEWDWEGAEAAFRRAIAENPNYALAHQWYAVYLGGRGRLQESLREMQFAQDLDPLSRIISKSVGWTLYALRRYDDAVAQLEQALQLDPNFPAAHVSLGLTYLKKGMPAKATGELERAISLEGRNPTDVAILSYTYAASGNTKAAEGIVAELEARSRGEYILPIAFAVAYTGLGKKDEAIRWLEKGVDTRDPNLAINLFDPVFDPLRSHPSFSHVKRRMALE